MLNRRLSEYIFYGSLVLIAAGIFLIRFIVLGNLNDKIELTDNNNIILQKQITNLEELVQDNKELQTSHIYELYDIVPSVYSGTELTYRTVAILELLGIDESEDIQRTVFVDSETTFNVDSKFFDLSEKYKMVEVQVFFTSQDPEVVNNFIDDLYENEQLFILRNLEYNVTNGTDFTTVSVNFLAIYDVDELEEES